MQQDSAQTDSILMKSKRPISEVLAAHTPDWMKLTGVIGTGETRKDGKPAIMIFTDSLSPEAKAKLPTQVEGYPVVIQETGTVKAY